MRRALPQPVALLLLPVLIALLGILGRQQHAFGPLHRVGQVRRGRYGRKGRLQSGMRQTALRLVYFFGHGGGTGLAVRSFRMVISRI